MSVSGGIKSLIEVAVETGKQYGIETEPTCDAKYLEIGVSSKSDNVNAILTRLSDEYAIQPEDCAFWGDEYVGIEQGIYGSDSFMLTEKTCSGVESFLGFLRNQAAALS